MYVYFTQTPLLQSFTKFNFQGSGYLTAKSTTTLNGPYYIIESIDRHLRILIVYKCFVNQSMKTLEVIGYKKNYFFRNLRY